MVWQLRTRPNRLKPALQAGPKQSCLCGRLVMYYRGESAGRRCVEVFTRTNYMSTTAIEETAIIRKTRELCETIVAQPEFQAIRRQIDEFMADEEAKSQYQTVMEKGEMLQQKQQMG